MHRAATIASVFLILFVPLASPALARHSGEPVAAAVLLTDDDPTRLAAALKASGATNVRDERAAGFIAFETRDPVRLESLLGASVLVAPVARAALVPNDPAWPTQWGPAAIGMPAAWDVEHGSTAVKIAIIDSGIDAAHPDIVRVSLELGTDYVEGDADPQDENGHGTHVAGIAAAARDNGIGIAGMASATVLVVRVLDEDAHGNCLDIALAILEAVARGAHVINMSLACSADYAPLHLAIQAAQAADALVVASAGNVGASGECPSFPGRYEEALSVGALEAPATSASYSCAGPSVDLAAPGSDIVSLWLGGSYASLSGTSMAAPHVTAAAALLKSQTPTLTSGDLRERLLATAVDLGDAGIDPTFGAGRVDVPAALSASGP